MNGYICIKALTLGGVSYTAGSNIPAEAVLPGRVRALIKQGYISPATPEAAAVPPKEAPVETIVELQQQIDQLQAVVNATQTELQQVTSERDELLEKLAAAPLQTGDPTVVMIPLTRDDGMLEVPAAPESIVAAVSSLQLTAEESIRGIGAMTDETALILIHALDSRKTVKSAAQARAEELKKAEQPEPPSSESGES